MKRQKTTLPARARKGGSFVWKITLRQSLRTIGLFFWINVVVTVLFWGGVWLGVERTASDLVADGDTAYSDRFFEVSTQPGAPEGTMLHRSLVNHLDLLPGSRSLYGDWGRPSQTRWFYSITTPIQGGAVAIVTFAPGMLWLGYLSALAILTCFEALCVLSGLFKISRSVRGTLRPINQLALTAHQSMTAQTVQQVQPSQPAPELQLGSTIDTLNAINENRLDTRIDVKGEREELRGLAMAINSMLDRVDFAYRSQLRFVSDASHELRTPISVIQGYANLLDRWGKEDMKTLEESIAAIKQEAESMKELVEQLLFLARSDNHSITLKMETVNLAALVQEVARESAMIDQNHKIVCPQRPSLPVRGDIQLLKQALRIFVDNALKYTPQEGKITLDAKEAEGQAALSVTDSGVGIGSDDLPRLFDRFYRADASRTRQTGGAGLGLSIAKWIVDSHGGVIDVLSREGLGTRMTIKMPLAQGSAVTFLTSPAPDLPLE